MMQVSTLYAHSLERQLVNARQSQKMIKNISRTCIADHQDELLQDQQLHEQQELPLTNYMTNEMTLTEAGVLPPELLRSVSCPGASSPQLRNNNNNNIINNYNSLLRPESTKPVEVDTKEYTDRLCKLPSQCKGSYILGSPRRYPNMNTSARLSATRLTQSAGNLNLSSHCSLVKTHSGPRGSSYETRRGSMDGRIPSMDVRSKTPSTAGDQKGKVKEKKEIKKLPSNFMYLGVWSTRQNSEKLLEQVQAGDILEFNIKFHHHWGVAVSKNKQPTLENLELAHLKKEKDGSQRAIKEKLSDYWTEGVTARINNSRDIHKPPASAGEVTATAIKMASQPHRSWDNSEQFITYCRYGEGATYRPIRDAARWGSLSKCLGQWLNLTSSRQGSPRTSPNTIRKRTMSVAF